jgi:histidinol phosphatase-like PHP family hydrolase|tara:strand:- start:144 stop:692 length:549 start_codon:yes stop_codon:yes gene_type:complete
VKLKIDLHTHTFEATGKWLDEDVVREIVGKAKEKGLDGIGITEHEFKSYGIQFKEIADRCCDGDILVIPGQEISVWPVEMVELFLPGDRVFRFICHPGFPPTDFSRMADKVQGIEINNALHGWQMDQERILAVAKEYDLLMLSNSDAHSLDDIGQHYNELSLDDLLARSEPYVPRRQGERRL